MARFKLKITRGSENGPPSTCCGSADTVIRKGEDEALKSCCPETKQNLPAWVVGNVMSAAGPVPKISTGLTRKDLWEHFKCRTTKFRNNYIIAPGLYAAGDPDRNSDVLVSANYKYSFDILRRELKGLNAWVLVLDTKGINVWCAAGKGTFGTDELVVRIAQTRLKEIVAHRQIIVPQLGAPGVSAHKVKQAAGFNVLFGPVLAKDIPAYIGAGYQATKAMRKIGFSIMDRMVLIPLEISPVMKKFLIFMLFILAVFGLTPKGIIFWDAISGGLPFILLGFVSVMAGALVTPLLLPVIPFRSFAIKGWLAGLISVYFSTILFPLPGQQNVLLVMIAYLFFPLVSSYLALQFTGSTTFTGMTGVKKELKISVPLYLGGTVLSIALLLVYKLSEWGII